VEQPPLRHGLIDTDILVDASRGFSGSGEFLNEMLAADGIVISAISSMELISGCRDGVQLAKLKEAMARFSIVPLTEAISNRAQTLMEAFTLSHRLGIPDALIAATALESGLALYTRNIRHYKMIPELLIIQPY
jgi:predicted nucleic acid-binding protein